MAKKQKEDNKTISIFRLLGYLIRGKGYTIEYLSEKLNIPARTIRRYLSEDLNDLGFVVEKDTKTKTYKISDNNVPVQLSYGFNQAEIDFLKEVLLAYGKHSLVESIMNKILEKVEKEKFVESITNITYIETLRKLTKAIQEKKKVILEDYYSIESQTIKNREVEPLAFAHRFTQVRCYEKVKDKVLSFNIRRIRNVKILEQPQDYRGDITPTDPFGLTSDKEIYVELNLSRKAYFLLQEEFPLSQKYLKQEQGKFLYKGFIRSFKGLGRFLLSLPGEIQIIEPESLKEFLQLEIKKFNF